VVPFTYEVLSTSNELSDFPVEHDDHSHGICITWVTYLLNNKGLAAIATSLDVLSLRYDDKLMEASALLDPCLSTDHGCVSSYTRDDRHIDLTVHINQSNHCS
jgi:hypothetical protein